MCGHCLFFGKQGSKSSPVGSQYLFSLLCGSRLIHVVLKPLSCKTLVRNEVKTTFILFHVLAIKYICQAGKPRDCLTKFEEEMTMNKLVNINFSVLLLQMIYINLTMCTEEQNEILHYSNIDELFEVNVP